MDGMKPDTGEVATVFEDEKGQAVRLPEGYRFDASEVTIRREGDTVLLEPVEQETVAAQRQRRWDEIFADLGEPFDDDMVEAALNRPGPEDFDRLNCDLRLKD